VRAAEADIVVADSRAQPDFRRDQHARFVESEAGQRLTDDRFRVPLRIGVGSIDQIDAALDGQGDEPRGLGTVEARNFSPDSGTGAKGHGAETKTGNSQP
jgi:hypothetical protein